MRQNGITTMAIIGWMLCALLNLCPAHRALAFSKPRPEGGWSSGGGYLLKDAHNPWYLNNVAVVRYCVMIDEKNFGATHEMVEDQLLKALAFWKSEFKEAILTPKTKFGPLQIAAQDFLESACDDADIRFQFGTLTHSQRLHLKDLSQIPAVSVRTHYSAQTLIGRGFVFLAPTRGPLAYDTQGLEQDVWSLDQGARIYLALLHELGHVFGLPHMGSYGELMSEGFVESILVQRTDLASVLRKNQNFFSLTTRTAKRCLQGLALRNWQEMFQLRANETCIQVDFDHGASAFGMTKLSLSAGISEFAEFREVGHADLLVTKFFPINFHPLWLSEEQDIFSPEQMVNVGFRAVLGPILMSITKSGAFVFNEGGTQRGLRATFDQGKSSITLMGVNGSGLIVDLL